MFHSIRWNSQELRAQSDLWERSNYRLENGTERAQADVRRRAMTNIPSLINAEAQRLLAVALGLLDENLLPDDAAAVGEIKMCLMTKKSCKSGNPVVIRALQIHTENPAKLLKKQQSFRLLEEASVEGSIHDSSGSESSSVKELRKAVASRLAYQSSNDEVNAAFDEYQQREAKINFLACAAQGKYGELQRIIDSGVLGKNMTDIRDPQGNTALALGVLAQQVNVVRLLLRSNIEATTFNDAGLTPLSPEGKVPLIALLEEYGAQKGNCVSKERGLFDAIDRRNIDEIIEQLKVISPNLVDDDGNTLIAMAAASGALNVVQLLSDRYHVRVNSVNRQNMSPLDLAKEEVAAYLRTKNGLTYKELEIRKALCDRIHVGKADIVETF